MVIEQPSDAVGTINDMWFSWIIDIGRPGPDRGQGGKYLIVGPDYDGPLPEGGYFVAHSKTNRVLYASRAYLVDNDPKPAVENVKENMKIYPYTEGAFGTSIAEALTGAVRLGEDPKVPETKFVEGSNVSFNTIPPSDFGFFEMINENVQAEPATSYEVELAGQLAAIGIVKGKEFAPDERMKKILTDAASVGQAAGRVLNWRPFERHPDWAYYDEFELGEHALGRRRLLRNSAARLRGRGIQAAAADRRPHARQPHGLLLRLHARQSRHDHEHSRRRLAVPDGLPGRGRRSHGRREDLQGDAAQGHPGQGVLVVHRLRQPDPLHARRPRRNTPAPARKAIPRRRRPRPRTAPRRYTSPPNSPMASIAATGSRPTRTRAGSPSCASTARCRRSSTNPGGRPKSRR